MSDVRLHDLTIEYSSGGYTVRPIDGLDLDLESGHLALLLGASGSGKTTLLSAIASLLTPTAGTIHVGDLDVTSLSGAALTHYRRHTVGVVFQAFNLIPSLTARENILVAARSAGVGRRDGRARADALLERVDLADRAHHRPGDLSGGQQQRVAIARALAMDPPLLLADEPTAHLDYIQVDSVICLLRELATPGRAVVIATHDERLLPLADRVVELTPRAAKDSHPPRRVELAPGDVLFRQGDTGDLVYVVDAGTIEIVGELADGGEEVIRVVPAGEYFGELAPMFGLRRSATARCGGGPAAVTGMGLHEFRERTEGGRPSFAG